MTESSTWNADAQTRTLVLRDGRRLSFREYGDPEGTPVLGCHNWGVSGQVFSWYDEGLRDSGCRLVVADRPGFGASQPLPGRTYADCVADVEQLADHLGIDRLRILGVSGGGPYALACAALLPDRVDALVVVGGNAPPTVPRLRSALSRDWRRLYVLSRHTPSLLRLQLRANYAPLASRQATFLDRLDRLFGPADVQVLAELRERHGDDFVAAPFADAVRAGPEALVTELAVEGGDWGFDPAAIRARTSLWHGTEDVTVPLEHSRYLADTIPGAWLSVVPGEGHLLLGKHLPEVVADLVELPARDSDR